jgi:RsiW-degrading membrane proteinase PrsW (M82 family)
MIVGVLSAAKLPIRDPSSPTVWDVGRATLLLCPITAVSCGSFGFLAGIAGSAAIYLRRRRIQGTKRLLIESAVAGFVLGFSVLQKHTDTDKEFTMN